MPKPPDEQPQIDQILSDAERTIKTYFSEYKSDPPAFLYQEVFRNFFVKLERQIGRPLSDKEKDEQVKAFISSFENVSTKIIHCVNRGERGPWETFLEDMIKAMKLGAFSSSEIEQVQVVRRVAGAIPSLLYKDPDNGTREIFHLLSLVYVGSIEAIAKQQSD